MKRIRLLSIAHSYVVGLNRRLAHEFARIGGDRWDITAVTSSHFQGTRDLRPVILELQPNEPCRVESVPAYMTSRVHFFWYGKRLKQLLSEPWDVVHGWEEPYVLAGWQIARWTRPSSRLVFVTAQNWSKSYPPPFSWMEKACLRKASGWIPFGKTIVDALIHRPGYRDLPYRTIPLGVDSHHFRPDVAMGHGLRQALGWTNGPPVVGFLGRFVEEKGLPLLMRVLDRVKTPWRALFVGAGPLEQELRDWAARRGDRVRICTQVGHEIVPRYLNAMDLLCAPSQTTLQWREQFGRMTIEAFACGVPVIGSDSGEIPHVLCNDGVVLAEKDEEAWAQAIGALLDSPVRRAQFAASGRERAVNEFDWSVVARRHLDFFEELLERSPAPLRRSSELALEPGARSAAPIPAAYRTSPPLSDPKASATPVFGVKNPRRLVSLGHSYVVAANRKLAYAMQQAGQGRWEVTVAAPIYFHGQKNDLRPEHLQQRQHEPCPLVPLRAFLTRSVHLFCYGACLRELFQQNWDMIHCWEEPYVVAGGQAAWWSSRSVPFVFRTAQSLDKNYPPPFDQMERFVLRRAAGWICSGRTVADNLVPRRGYGKRPMALIPLGVDTTTFQPDPEAGNAVRRQLGWTDDGPPVVGYLGRFTSAKGLDVMLRTLDGVRTPWRALFVGAGPQLPELTAWASRFPDRVRICTHVLHDEVPRYLNAMDVLCAPSQTTPNWREQFGRMLIEAFACGVSVIGSNSGEIPFVIGETGRVVGEKDEAGWQNAVGELLENASLRKRLGDAGRERAIAEYEWSVIGRKHLNFFESLLDGRAK